MTLSAEWAELFEISGLVGLGQRVGHSGPRGGNREKTKVKILLHYYDFWNLE